MRMWRAAAAVGMVLCLTACSAAGPTPVSSTKAPGGIAITDSPDYSGASLPWTQSPTKATDTEIRVGSDKRGCTVPTGFNIVESATTITIAARGTTLAEPCTAEGLGVVTYLHLNKPLGTRHIMHAPTQWPGE